MANRFTCEWCSGGFRTESGLAWHIERSHSVQIRPDEMTPLQPVDERERPTTIEEEPTAMGQDEQLPPKSPEPTLEEIRAELVEIINAVVKPLVSDSRSEFRSAITAASNKAELKAFEEKRAETDRRVAREAMAEKQSKIWAEMLENNEKVTAVLTAICIGLDAKLGDEPNLIDMVANRLNARDRAATRELLGSYFLLSSFGARAHYHHRPLPFSAKK